MTKEELLSELSLETHVALKPSAIHGIGVFAICDIPKGCKHLFSKNEGNWIKISFEEAEKLPAHSKDLIETYCLFDESAYFVPDDGFKLMDLVNFLNHSSTPNIISVEDGAYFETLRNIKKGEELFVDYGELVEGMDEYR